MAVSRRAKGCTLQLHGQRWIVLYRDPGKNGKAVRHSLKTTDRAIAEHHKTHLDRILADKSLWNLPPDDCPQQFCEIWLWDQHEVSITVGGKEVRVHRSLGQLIRI